MNFSRDLALKIYRALLCIIAFTLPLSINLNNYAIVLLFFVFLISREKVNLKDLHTICFVLLFLSYLISLSYSTNQTLGYASIERKLVLIILPIVLMNIRLSFSVQLFETLMKCFIMGIFLAMVINVFFIDSVLEHELRMRIHPTYLGMFIVFSLFYLLFTIRTKFLRGRVLIFVIFLMSVLFSFLVILAAKMPLLIFVLLLSGCVLIEGVQKKKLALYSLAILTFFVFTFIVLKNFDHTKERFKQFFFTLDDTRRDNWKANIQVIKENFFLGVGTGDSVDELNRYRRQDWFTEYNTYNSHNQYLDTFVRTGIFGFLILIFMLIYQYRAALKFKDNLYLIFLLIFTLSLLTESMLEVQKGITFYSFFAPLFARIDNELKHDQ